MAVQKDRVTRSRRGMRRSHDALTKNPPVSYDAETGKPHLRHHITKEGFYRGKQVIVVKSKPEIQKDEE